MIYSDFKYKNDYKYCFLSRDCILSAILNVHIFYNIFKTKKIMPKNLLDQISDRFIISPVNSGFKTDSILSFIPLFENKTILNNRNIIYNGQIEFDNIHENVFRLILSEDNMKYIQCHSKNYDIVREMFKKMLNNFKNFTERHKYDKIVFIRQDASENFKDEDKYKTLIESYVNFEKFLTVFFPNSLLMTYFYHNIYDLNDANKYRFIIKYKDPDMNSIFINNKIFKKIRRDANFFYKDKVDDEQQKQLTLLNEYFDYLNWE